MGGSFRNNGYIVMLNCAVRICVFLLILILGGSFLSFSPVGEWISLLKGAFNPILNQAAGFPLGEQMDQVFGL